MIRTASPAERGAVAETLREAYMEIYPATGIAERLKVLGPGACLAITCSPSRGIAATLDLATVLVGRGYRVVPHIAARMVRDHAHLRGIVARLNDLAVDSVFVPGGDAPQPAGTYSSAFELLRALVELDHRFSEIGVAAHPEGHPSVSGEVMLQELEKKQTYATYLVTQVCFSAASLGRWLGTVRDRGMRLPAWIGLPGICDRTSLLRTSLRIGVGDSIRFLSRQNALARHLMRKAAYSPEALLSDLAPLLADPGNRIRGCHIFSFNQVETTERWRRRSLAALEATGPAPEAGR